MTKDEFTDLVGIEYADEYEKAQLSLEVTTKDATFSCGHENDTISRQAAIDAAELAYVRGTFPTPFIREVPPAQPKEAIPVSWIEAKIAKFMMADDTFSGLTASIINAMLNEWKREQEGATT